MSHQPLHPTIVADTQSGRFPSTKHLAMLCSSAISLGANKYVLWCATLCSQTREASSNSWNVAASLSHMGTPSRLFSTYLVLSIAMPQATKRLGPLFAFFLDLYYRASRQGTPSGLDAARTTQSEMEGPLSLKTWMSTLNLFFLLSQLVAEDAIMASE